MINDPDQRAEFETDVAAVADALPALDPALRKVMAGFFELVGHQIDDVERIQQRCAQRVKRFTAFGTMEQSRGVAHQLNDAITAQCQPRRRRARECNAVRSPTIGPPARVAGAAPSPNFRSEAVSGASSLVALSQPSGSANLWIVRSTKRYWCTSEPLVYGRSYLSHSARTRTAICA
jgi:hypothetical protein